MTTTTDDLDALRAAARRVADAEKELQIARDFRDAEIRRARRTTDHTVAEVAAAAGVSKALVGTVTRGAGRQTA